jgi:hypothetical protein
VKGDKTSVIPVGKPVTFKLYNKKGELLKELTVSAKVGGSRDEPEDPPDEEGPNGCLELCIKSLDVKAGGTFGELHVVTAEPVDIQVQVSEDWATNANGDFVDKAGSAGTPQPDDDVKLTVEELTSNTTYHYMVRTTDAFGKKATKTGSFTTLKRYGKVTFEKIFVNSDSDPLASGELTFTFEVNGSKVGTWGEVTLENGQKTYPNLSHVTEMSHTWLNLGVKGSDDDSPEADETASALEFVEVKLGKLDELKGGTFAFGTIPGVNSDLEFTVYGTLEAWYAP